MAVQSFFESNLTPSKKLGLDIDGISAATTRAIIMPDQDVDLGMTSYTTVTIAAGDFITVLDATDGQLKKINASDLLPTNAVNFQGGWDPTSGTFPGGGTGSIGDLYVATAAGTVDGITFAVGDSIYASVANAATGTFVGNWVQVNASDAVNSVFGRTGIITAQPGDYNAGQVTFTPAGTISATNVQAAIEEVATEAASSTLADGNIYIGSGANVATPQTLSGDVTITNAGVATVAQATDTVAGKVELATAAEALAVTVDDRAVTPLSLASLIFENTTKQTYTNSNANTVRTINRNAFTLQELCDYVCTFVNDCRTRGVVA